MGLKKSQNLERKSKSNTRKGNKVNQQSGYYQGLLKGEWSKWSRFYILGQSASKPGIWKMVLDYDGP